MASSIYSSKDGSPYNVDDDEENFEDLSESPALAHLKQERMLHEQKVIESSDRSLRLILESQQVANETSLELTKQHEQLNRTNQNLNKINNELNTTDRRVKAMKSIWGTVGNWFRAPVKPNTETPIKCTSKLTQETKNQNIDEQSNFQTIDKSVDLSWEGGIHNPPNNPNDIVDRNLDSMLEGLQVLKGQGLQLGAEIDRHNVLLDDIHKKTVKVDARIESQNMNIRKILK